MVRIIAIFFSAAVFLTAFDAAGKEITLSGGSPAMLEKVLEFDRYAASVFKTKNVRRRKVPLDISFSGTSYRLFYRRGGLVLILPQKTKRFDQPESCRALLSALLFRQYGTKLPENAHASVPFWLCAAVVERIDSYSKAERFIHGIRFMPTVSSMMAVDHLPDITRVMTLPADFENPWYRQYSRTLFEIAFSKGLVADFTAGLCKSPSAEPVVKRLEKELSALLVGKRDISSLIWNAYLPEPAARKIRDLDFVRKIPVPEMNDKEEYVGKNTVFTIEELPALLARRPDAEDIRRTTAARWRNFAIGSDYGEQTQLRLMTDLIFSTADPAMVSRKLAAEMKKFDKMLQLRRKRELYLFQADHAHSNVNALLHNRFGAGLDDVAITGEQQKFLLEIEKIYAD